MEIALGIQRPGQTKEQTKLIARGIEQGIAQYKKRYSAKERAFNKVLNQRERAVLVSHAPDSVALPVEAVPYRQHRLPWVLLILTWLGIAAVAVWLMRGQI